MQKHSMFESFLKKKQLIAQMIAQTKSLTSKDNSRHFQAVSEPVYIKAESNAIYLTHLNNQFKDQLREFVHEQEGYNQTMFQLAKITEALQTEKGQFQNEFRGVRNALNQVELDRAVLIDKNNAHLDKIIRLQEQAKTYELLGEQHEKTATELEEQIEYEKCMLQQIKGRNNEIVSNLEVKTVQIEQATMRMENVERSIRHKESMIKKTNQEIKDIYFTLEAQDDTLTGLCTDIEEGLNAQNNRINDIEFIKNRLTVTVQEAHLRKLQLVKAEETETMLLNYEDDLKFELRRVGKQLELEEKGIEEEQWKIAQQQQRLEENSLMLLDLQNYLRSLIEKNSLLEQSLEEQIIQDHTIKRIVESKTCQPVGKKTKLLLQECEDKELLETSSSWKENKRPCKAQIGQYKVPNNSVISPKERRELVEREVNKLSRKGPQQMDFICEKGSLMMTSIMPGEYQTRMSTSILPKPFNNDKYLAVSKQYYQQEADEYRSNRRSNEIEQGCEEENVRISKWESNNSSNPYISTNAFSYIDKLTRLDADY